MLEPRDRLIFALDVPNRDKALHYVNELRDEVGLFKVGLELFLAEGQALLRELANKIGPERIFLDLKLYDIPATVRGALKTLPPGLALITVPSDLGWKGLEQIMEAVGGAYRVLAVTLLTSANFSVLQELGYAADYIQDPSRLVLRRAEIAWAAGCHGVVCSGREVKAIKEACGPDFLAVCPGIRPDWAAVPGDDQQRIVTPYEAIKNGSDYIVVGRPIRQAPNPAAAARRVVEEIALAMRK